MYSMTEQEKQVERLCQKVILSVGSNLSQEVLKKLNFEKASVIMKEEVNAFLWGDKYKNERECVLLKTLSEQTVFFSLVTECVARILKEAI